MRQSSLEDRFDGQPQRIDRVDQPVDVDEVLRYLGYPAGRQPNARMESTFTHWIDVAAQSATPRGVYVVLPVADISRRSLRLQSRTGVHEFRGAIAEFLGPARLVAAFISTAGPQVEQLASELMSQRDELAAMIVNAVGAERAEAAESAIVQRLREQCRLVDYAPSLPYSPGYCGMALTEQRTLFSLFGETTAGVTLTEDCLMRPLKSVSGLVGLGPADIIRDHGSPCDRCELYSCAMRR